VFFLFSFFVLAENRKKREMSATIEFRTKERRPIRSVYTIPKSYLELIKLFRNLLVNKR